MCGGETFPLPCSMKCTLQWLGDLGRRSATVFSASLFFFFCFLFCFVFKKMWAGKRKNPYLLPGNSSFNLKLRENCPLTLGEKREVVKLSLQLGVSSNTKRYHRRPGSALCFWSGLPGVLAGSDCWCPCSALRQSLHGCHPVLWKEDDLNGVCWKNWAAAEILLLVQVPLLVAGVVGKLTCE